MIRLSLDIPPIFKLLILAGIITIGGFMLASYLTGPVELPTDDQVIDPSEQTLVTVKQEYQPNRPERAGTSHLIDLMKEDPTLNIQEWGGIQLPGGAGRASMMMSLAGGTAPDVYYCWFHIIQNDIRQGFLHPLDQWIGTDVDKNGIIDDDEAIWEGWKEVPTLWRRVAMGPDGHVYGVPKPGMMLFGLIYRKDMVAEAGLDPENPPRTWDEFWYWCQRLTYPGKDVPGAKLKRGQRGYALGRYPWFWLPWMQSAGGSPIQFVIESPTTGKEYAFTMDDFGRKDLAFKDEKGDPLPVEKGQWRANFGGPRGVEAGLFYHKLRWAPWIRDGLTQEPVDLPEQVAKAVEQGERDRGSVWVTGTDRGRLKTVEPGTAGAREITFGPNDIIRGGVRAVVNANDPDQGTLIATGEVAIMQWNVEQLEQYSQDIGVPTELIGMFPFPGKTREHKPVFQVHKHYISMTEQSKKERTEEDLDKIWKVIEVLTSPEVRDAGVRQKVMSGNAMWCRPDDLKRLGLTEYLRDVPDSIKRYYDEVERGKIRLVTEPFAGFWQAASDILDRNVLSFILSEKTGLDFPIEQRLKEADVEANTGAMFQRTSEELDTYRPTARIIFGIGVAVVVTCVFLIIRSRMETKAGGTGGVEGKRVVAWLMLLPALLTIAVWTYYPLLRGVVMAFQDYRIVGDSEWVGLDNFISVALDSNTWVYVRQTIKFVGLTLLIGFLAPIVLAFLFSEVPRGKVFFRTLFFLPQMSSGIVIALLWKLMYDPTENGTLNQILLAVGLDKQDWLGDPAWAMLACILPGVWAGAGMQSLIYVAALKSLPDDYYEAAALDGAGLFTRVWHVALPQIMPLVVINFVGAFINAFQNMGHIFLLTFGGPGNETNVLGLAIWKLAYNDLRFSTATTLAWYLGVALIAFTYFQIRFLRKVEFRRAETN